jgi:hypothetical protein
VKYPTPAEAELPVEKPQEQGKTARKRTSKSTSSRSKKGAPKKLPVKPPPEQGKTEPEPTSRRPATGGGGLLDDLFDGIAAAFGGRR